MSALVQDVAEGLRAEVLLAVIRAVRAQDAVAAGHALAAGGVRALEVTFTTPGASEAIAELSRTEDLLVGAGTVMDPDQAGAAIAAGARFLVSPSLVPEVLDVGEQAGVLTIPGALTPTEVVAAASRAPIVKLFPAGLGGPAYLRSLLAPLPELSIIPTGGVAAGNVCEWLAAGAFAVGAGADLCPPDRIAAADFQALSDSARRYRAAIDTDAEGRA